MSPLQAVGSAQGHVLLSTWQVFFVCGIIIAAIVYALIFLSLVFWRKKSEELPRQFARNIPLEVTYTVIPLLIVIGLFYITITHEWTVEAETKTPATIVHVTGYQWSWRFDYSKDGVRIDGTPQAPPEFALPLGETSRIVLDSADVNHAFWIPQFLFKRDAIPGFTNSFDLTPTRPGLYHGLCGEFCGLDHAMMTFSLRVLPPAQFRAWLLSHRKSP